MPGWKEMDLHNQLLRPVRSGWDLAIAEMVSANYLMTLMYLAFLDYNVMSVLLYNW